MKKCLCLLLAALLMLPAVFVASATSMTEEELISSADGKTVEAEAFEASEQDGKTVYTSIGKLASGIYVVFTGSADSEDGYVECRFFAEGELQTAWLKEDEIVPATTEIYFADGSRVLLPDSIARDEQVLSEYCSKYFPGRLYTADENSALLDFDAVLSAEGAAALYGDAAYALNVSLVRLGLYRTTVITAKGPEEVEVPTAQLIFGDNADADKRIAVVYAPKGGEASLRETASQKGTLITMAKAGRIVGVQEVGATFTKILYDGVEGYIRTDCLNFHAGDKAPLGSGILHIKGNVDSTGDISLRNATSNAKAKVISLMTGTVVNVYETSGDWYGVEYDGWYGFVQKQYLNMNEE